MKYDTKRHFKRLRKRWSDLVRRRDGNECVMGDDCLGVNKTVYHAHHIYNEGKHKSMALLPENGVTLCFVCHRATHDDPLFMTARLKEKLDRGRLEYLESMARHTNLVNRVFLDQMEINLDEFECELNEEGK